MTVKIDAHQHFWDLSRSDIFDYAWLAKPDKAAIHHSYLPEHLLPKLKAAGIAQTIFVQTQHVLAENIWALKLAEANPFIAGVVGWVDLQSEACEEQLGELMEEEKFVGVRHITQDEVDDDFIVRSDVLRGLRVLEQYGVPFDLLFFVKHLRHAVTLAEKLPALPMVIDHLAKPEIASGRMENWRDHFLAASDCPNIYCKLSGMVTEADWIGWTVDDLRPYVDFALECFGPSRLMFGSDWPVCELASQYGVVVESLRELLADLSVTEQEQIFGKTAQQFYRIAPSDGTASSSVT
ncbi:MAG: amidohydrolase [Planctomycetaceae bacterium]|nr:amidohydrolase [Planctomycetaceae bacterium]